MKTIVKPAPVVPHDGQRLFMMATTIEGLRAGWNKVRDNDGAAGGDRMSIGQFGIGSDRRLQELSEDLRNGSYRPSALRSVDIPKAAGGFRRLNIPAVRDRVVQTAVALVLGPLFEAEFEDVSFAYRLGRSVKQALMKVQNLRAEGFVWTVDADIQSFFDNVPHDLMMDRLRRSISDGPLVDLIGVWLESAMAGGRGLAQGSPLSPLLANLYLDDLDEALAESHIRLVRFADDFVVLTKSPEEATQQLRRVTGLLKDYGLELHPEKTRIRGYDDGLKFLGQMFVRSFMLPDPDRPELSEVEKLLAEIAAKDRAHDETEMAKARDENDERIGGYDRGLKLLYVYGKGRNLGLKNLSFAVYEKDESQPNGQRLLLVIHASRVDRIEIGPDATVDTSAMRNALAYGVEIAFVNGHGETEGHVLGPLPARGRRHLAQARVYLDPNLRVDLARRIVDGRIRNMRALLRRINQRRGLDEVTQVTLSLNKSLQHIVKAETVQQLLGWEGESTARFWRGWSALLLHGWTLPARQRRPALDPVNAVLNVVASLLTRDMSAVVSGRGLHKGFGVLHSIDDGHDACVYDLVEIFRAGLVEGVVLNLFNTRVLRPEHFADFQDGKRLNANAFSAVIRGYEERCESLVKSVRSDKRVTWRRLMIEQAEAYAAHVENGKGFQAYVMDY